MNTKLITPETGARPRWTSTILPLGIEAAQALLWQS